MDFIVHGITKSWTRLSYFHFTSYLEVIYGMWYRAGEEPKQNMAGSRAKLRSRGWARLRQLDLTSRAPGRRVLHRERSVDICSVISQSLRQDTYMHIHWIKLWGQAKNCQEIISWTILSIHRGQRIFECCPFWVAKPCQAPGAFRRPPRMPYYSLIKG